MSKTRNLFAKRKDGTEFPIEAGLSSVQTKDGMFVMTFLTDITERKQAEEEIARLNESLERRARESETRYQQIVELAEEGVWVIDSEAKTTYANQAMARMLGYTEAQMLGRPIFDFMDEADHQVASSNVERRKQGTGEKQEFKLKAKDGKAVWTYMSTSPVLDENGKMLWSCSLVYDITERKQADEQLRESSERISLANAELARATRLKDEFLASMSHELRTPLNAILGLSEALQEEVYGPLTDKQRKSLATIEQSGKHLLELINDILDLSKIESGKMEFQIAPVSVQILCESSLTFVRQQAHQKNIKLNSKIAEELGQIAVDERRIRQVLVNLLSNAVKFTPEGGEVWVEVEPDPEAEILQLRVIDTGIGIAPENLDKLFKPFVQLDSRLSRRYAGTGLGLALVRRIVELHGGSISLESEVGKGSRFTVNLPWKEPQGMMPSVGDTEQALLELFSIHQALIVEDSEAAAKHIARYMGELGAAVHIHPQGEGTLKAALEVKPDVIILDLLLPNLSGWEVLAQLKANQATQHIPVLVVSVVDERSQALALGASEYMLKPISRQQLHSTLSKIFSPLPQPPGSTALAVVPDKEQQLPLILLAEDNEANISTLLDYLQVHGLRVSLARNGIEAVQMTKQQKPDVILMDIQMPEMDGLEAIQRIRTDAELAMIPIIALTALAMPGDRERCLAAGATEYMTKPVGLKKLVNIISQYVNLSNS
jgi:PAS domain S-box-containing protein